jgi:tight adherence protein B
MPPIIIVLAIGVGVASLVAFVTLSLVPSEQTSSAEQRLEAMVNRSGKGRRGAAIAQSSLLLSEGPDPAGSLFALWAKKLPKLTLYLQQADVAISPSQLILIVLVAFLGGTAAIVISPLPVLLAPLVGLMLCVVPLIWLMHKRNQRLAKFGRQLPEALELLSRSLRAGHSLAAGIGLVGNEFQAPLGREFRRVFEEQNLGIALDEALQDLTVRIPNLDLSFFATAVVLQRTTGGDLAEILEKIARLIRERLQLLGQVNALTGEGRLSGVVLLAMPPGLFLFMLYINPEYVTVLFQDTLGHYMLSGALVTQVIGALVIKKIITIKV